MTLRLIPLGTLKSHGCPTKMFQSHVKISHCHMFLGDLFGLVVVSDVLEKRLSKFGVVFWVVLVQLFMATLAMLFASNQIK